MINVITDNIDIWTSAQKKKKAVGRGSNKKFELYGIKKLRVLILNLAVHGKLIPQDPSDEASSRLIEKMSEEKEKLIKENKIKRQKQLIPIEDEEKPFKLPTGWSVARLGELSHLITKGTTPTSIGYSFEASGISFLKIENLDRGRINKNTITQFISEETNEALGRSQLCKGDILFSIAGTIGKTAIIYADDLPANTNQALAIIRGTQTVYSPAYLRIQLDSFVAEKTRKKARGGAMPNVSLGDLTVLVSPIPPLKEQYRIAAKVEELMALCDQLEQEEIDNKAAHQTLVKTLLNTLTTVKTAEEFKQSWQRIAEHFDTLFTTEESIEELKQTILQLAVMGKLAPQDSNDEPASELLKNIEKEKERLVKEQKIKKPIVLDKISEDEKPFSLPASWEFFRFGDITNRIGSGSTPRGGKSAYQNEGIIFLRSQNIHNYGLKLEDVAYINDETHTKMNNTKVVPDDILLNITGGSLGRSTIYPKDIGEANVSQHVTIIRPTIKATNRYLHYCILSPYIQGLIWRRQVGMAREGLSKKVLELFEIPFPPLEEQHRIVNKVDELMVLCNSLKSNICEAQETQVLLADAITEHAV